MSLRYAVLTLLSAGFSSTAQSMECVVDLMVPRYNLSARRSATGGTVTAKILLGPNGKATEIAFDPGDDKNVADEVRAYLMRETKFAEACAGKEIELKFTFRLEGEAQSNPPIFFYFRPPNHFVIVSRPQKPIIN